MFPRFEEYVSLNAASKIRVCEDLLRCHAKRFELLSTEHGDCLVPTVRDTLSGLVFNLVPGGAFRMGLSEREERTLRTIQDPPPLDIARLRPVRDVNVNTFLVSSTPVTIQDYFRLGTYHPTEQEVDYCRKAYEMGFAAYITRDDALAAAHSIGCRLPYEAEWEYSCRATTQTLFVWGQDLPSYDEQCAWLLADYSDDFVISRNYLNCPLENFHLRCNAFGLYGLFVGEWCMDPFRANYDPATAAIPGEYAVRGGGSLFWPWQNIGWVWCISAMRISSRETEDGKCAFRLVYELTE